MHTSLQASLHERHSLSERDLQPTLNLLRTFGVRRKNVLYNTGSKAYAFNSIQRAMLPASLCPPENTCGKSVS